MKMLRILSTACIAVCCMLLCASAQAKPTVYIIGDSTVSNYSSGAIAGWGMPIAGMFDTTRVNVVNKARGGRSSRTFLNEGLWKEVCDMLQPGDFVLMGFGHNDGNPAFRGSVMGGVTEDVQEVKQQNGTVEKVHTFGWYMNTYVTETKAKGAHPILFSQIPWRELYDGKSKRCTDTFSKWMAEIAAAQKCWFVDLNARVADKYEAMGQEKVNTFFPGDHTHTNMEGATLNAQTMIEGIKALENCPLTGYIK